MLVNTYMLYSTCNEQNEASNCLGHSFWHQQNERRAMRQLPTQRLNPKVKSVWRINDLIWIVLLYVACGLPFIIVAASAPEEGWWATPIIIVATIVLVVLIMLFEIILPPIRYSRWRYEVTPEYLDIAKGIIWRKRYIVPFIRVQNTDTRQGPILRAFGLSSVTVSTAAGSHEIPGLVNEEASQLRDRAAEFARLAREDV